MAKNGEQRRVVPAAEFIVAWQKAESIAEFCAATGMKNACARFRAWSLRKRGVPLKMMHGRSTKALDVPALAALAKKHAPKDG